MIPITLNGAQLQCPPGSLADLVAAQGWQGQRIAIERNGMIVPKSQYGATTLCPNDALEVVVAVGGG